MKRFFFGLALGLLIVPTASHAATTDLSIPEHGINFSVEQDKMVVGSTVRVYAKVRNVGQTDVSGLVEFFQGDTPIGQSQAISLRANGATEEVFVDFVVPHGTFNIRAQIGRTEPPDSNLLNDTAITGLLTPIEDQDRDGVPDAQDNCPTASNADQANADTDAAGNACDEDDDNDSLTDAVEAELGTNPRSADSDADGVLDAQDAYPNDASRSKVPPPEQLKPVAEPVKESPKTTETAPVAGEQPQTQGATVEPSSTTAVDPATAVSEPITDFHFSPKAVFRYERLGWNKYQFDALSPESPGYHFAWDFGDGVTSNKKSVAHTYHGYGAFKVLLQVSDPQRVSSEDSTTIVISFFSIQNRAMEVVIGLLALLLLIGLAFTIRAFKVPKKDF